MANNDEIRYDSALQQALWEGSFFVGFYVRYIQ
jgi:hypothetical protein